MTKQGNASRLIKLVLFLGIAVTGMDLFGNDEGKNPARNVRLIPHMQTAYQSLIRVLATVSKDQDAVRSVDIVKTEAHLKILADEAKAIHSLVVKDDIGHEFLSLELQRSTGLAYSRYKSGFREQAKFHISEVLNTCFSCHTSRNSVVDSGFTTLFTKDLDLEDFDSLARARFLSLSRQFEASATAYEKLLLARSISMDEMVNFDPIVEYLILTLRVRDDASRALKTLTQMKKQNYPEVFKRDIESWSQVLTAIPTFDPKMSSLDQAKKLIAQAKGSMEFPRDRSGMVQYILASKYLHLFLNDDSVPKELKAQAYYELGGCEVIIASQFSTDEANTYFSEVIRLLPRSELARKAYARFEENILYGYSGSSGLQLPADEKSRMSELKKQAFGS